MTDNLPAVRPQQTPVVADLDSWVEVMRPILALAERIAETEFVPKKLRGSVPATAAAMLYGREVGLAPMTALNMTDVIEGKPGVNAEAMRSLVYAAGHELEFVETTGALCTMRGRRRGQENWTTLTWSIDMARAANLLGKDNWKYYPRAMLQARCTTELCRMVFPDVIHGFRSVEELEDMGDQDGTVPGLPAPTVTQKVGRKRAASKAKALPAPEKPSERPMVSGPPLPGEDGYDALPVPGGGGSSVGSGDAEGEAAEPEPTDTTPVEQQQMDAEAAVEERRGPRLMSRPQQRMLEGLLTTIGVDNVREERHLIASQIIGRDIASFTELLHTEATTLIDTLGRIKAMPELMELLDAIDAQADTEETHDG